MIERLAVLLAVAVPVAVAAVDGCDILKYAEEVEGVEGVERGVYVGGERRTIVVVWSSEAEGAAAALLVAVLRLVGYTSTALRHEPRARSLLYLSQHYDHSQVLVVLAAQWSHGEVWSVWLRAAGAGVVPVSPRLHRRCLRRDATCYLDDVSNGHKHTKLYVVEEWKGAPISGGDEAVPVHRGKLLELIRSNDSEPFMFLDVELWSDEANVVEVIPVSEVGPRSIRVADNDIWLYSPALWHLLSYFEPRRAELRDLLTVHSTRGEGEGEVEVEDPMVAVCEWAAASPLHVDRLRHWTHYVNVKLYRHYIYIVLCNANDTIENDTFHEYLYLIDKLEAELNVTSCCIALRHVNVTCEGEDEDEDEGEGAAIGDIDYLMQTEKFYRTIGVIGPGLVFRGITSVADTNKLTLISYSTYGDGDGDRTVGTTGGRAGGVVRALRDLLAACSWTRLAVLSGPGRAATALSAALGAASDLNMKNVPLTSNRTAIRDVLVSLISSDVHIFLVNAGARLAGEVMRVAARLHVVGAGGGRVWLAREWVGAADADVAPYELTFAWRGGGAVGADGADGVEDARAPLRAELAERWARRGSWPLHAAPLADAVLALGNGYQQIFANNRNLYDDVHSDDAYESFWKLTETEAMPRGLVQKLRFKDRDLRSPRVFLYRWNGTSAELVLEWRIGVGDVGRMQCPVPDTDGDGSVHCVIPLGDRFDQRCGDWGLLAGVLALTALIPTVVMAAMAARRALRTRDAHLVKRAEEMLEARWRAKASRLEPYFVERRALELREEIGAGRFGRVRLAFLRGGGATVVAAKALREDAAPVEETEFFREARALAALQHDHVVRFVGVCVTDGPPLLLMEYAFFGDLLRYLRARRHLAASDSPEAAQVSAEALTRFARQAATALAYLARRGFVHRDVRASNCLVDERRRLKLADFGMARATRSADGAPDGEGEYTSRRRALFPVLWMAPESLSRGVFSPASDVWALGVLALELVTLGARPYGSLSPLQVHHAVVTEGRRPPLPLHVAAETRAALTACWRRAPGDRPSAGALAAWLETRPTALRPAPLPTLDDRAEDVDSGIGEPRSRSPSSASPPPPPPAPAPESDIEYRE